MRSPIPVIDAHGHLRVNVQFPYKTNPDEMLAVMDSMNIEAIAVTAALSCWNDAPRGNAQVDQVVLRYPKRFLGYVTVNPHIEGEAIRELERWSHFHRPPLIKLHPGTQKYPVNGAKFAPVWDYANQTGAIVLVHTWESHPFCSPSMFPSIGRAYPNVRILMGHSGVTWKGIEQAQVAAREIPNLYLELCSSQRHRLALEQSVQRVGAERILFGSDMPALEAACTLADVLTSSIGDGDKELILRSNFLRLLGTSV